MKELNYQIEVQYLIYIPIHKLFRLIGSGVVISNRTEVLTEHTLTDRQKNKMQKRVGGCVFKVILS